MEATPAERALPPIQPIAIAIFVLIVTGGVYTAAHLPRHVPQGPTIALLSRGGRAARAQRGRCSRASRASRGGASARSPDGSSLAYVVIAGMLEYVFVYDHTSGTQLVILTLMLAVFAVNVPMLLGFSVARFDEPGE